MVYQKSFKDTTKPASVVGAVNSANQVQIEIPIVNKVNNDMNTTSEPTNAMVPRDQK